LFLTVISEGEYEVTLTISSELLNALLETRAFCKELLEIWVEMEDNSRVKDGNTACIEEEYGGDDKLYRPWLVGRNETIYLRLRSLSTYAVTTS
jgi:hypothetical protein